MNPIKKYLELLKVSHYIRLITFAILTSIGALFGTDGVLELELLRGLFDIIMWVGIIPISIYALLLTIIGIYNVTSKTAYQVGDYNKWRDGDFDEWKKKNNIGTGKIDKFIDWLDDPFNVYKKR